MKPVFELVLENFRSFVRHQSIPVYPLTFLVGENSTGKTTFLSALAAVCDSGGFPYTPRFNQPPYNLGAFDTIATHKGGRYGRAKAFSLGSVANPPRHLRLDNERRLISSYRNGKGLPEFFRIESETDTASATLEVKGAGTRRIISAEWQFEGESNAFTFPWPESMGPVSHWTVVWWATELIQNASDEPGRPNDVRKAAGIVSRLFDGGTPIQALSLAPVRTRPERTYDKSTGDFSPEGDDVPFILLDELAFQKETDFQKTLESYGSRSGLFRRIGVRRLGRKPGDPYQLVVTVSGSEANLIDVGYGVSQALPVFVQCLKAPAERLLLMQQPEVHLHPRAQAELGSFFVDQVYHRSKKLVVETHSDYILDRVRMDVSRGRLDPSLVSILYFEKNGHETTVHQLSLDEQGNILNAPPTYRQFFLREELSLITRGAQAG